jgi:hypothetical protein
VLYLWLIPLVLLAGLFVWIVYELIRSDEEKQPMRGGEREKGDDLGARP